MSLVKYRLKEVAADFGVAAKEISDIIGAFGEKPKSNSQVLTDQELNLVFDVMTQRHPIDSLEQVFAVQPKPKAEAPKAVQQPKPQPQQPKAENTAAPQGNTPVPPKAEKPREPERKRERRVVDTSAVQVNAARFDDRVDALVSERVQNYQGGKQRIGGKKGQQQNKKDNKFRGNKSRNEEQEKMRRLQMEVAR